MFWQCYTGALQKPLSFEEQITKQLHQHGFCAIEAGEIRIAMENRRANPLSVRVWELGWSAAVVGDTWNDIDERCAGALRSSMSFVDFIIGESPFLEEFA